MRSGFCYENHEKVGIWRACNPCTIYGALKTSPKDTKTYPGRPNRPPGCLYSASRRPQDASKSPPGRFQDVQQTENLAQGSPPGLQGDSMAPQDAPRTRPRCLQDGSKMTSNRFESEIASYIAFGNPKLVPNGFQNRSKRMPERF